MSQNILDWFAALTGPHDSEPLVTILKAIVSALGNTKCPGKLCDPAVNECQECGIRGVTDGKTYKYRAECLAKKIAEAALREWSKWHSPTGDAQWERDPAHFGDLIDYWLSVTGIPNKKLAIKRGTYGNYGEKKIPLKGAFDPLPSGFANSAVENARKSHFDWDKGGVGSMPWSAAFVVACVRSVEIDHGIAYETKTDQLLLRSDAHLQYTKEAYEASMTGKKNRYWTIELTNKVKKGDIIVQDREPAANLLTLLALKDVTSTPSHKTHGDIVVDFDGSYAVTIGGNVEFEPDFDQSGSVRKRKFLLHDGKLVINSWTHFLQEKDNGKIESLRADYLKDTLKVDHRNEEFPYDLKVSPSPIPRKSPPDTKALHPQSTDRIFALLRLVDDCPEDMSPEKAG